MSQTIKTKDGIILNNVPDDATDDQIKERLASIRAAPERRLNTRDKRIQTHINEGITPVSLAADQAQDLDPVNIQELESQISRTKDPKQLEILVDEHNRIKELAQEGAPPQVPAPPAKPPTPDRNVVAQHPLTRFAMSAASPFTGAAQIMEKGQSSLSEMMGGPKMDVVQKHMAKVDELAKTGPDDLAGGAADVAGAILSPLPMGAARQGASLARKALTNAGVGAGVNVAMDAGKDPITSALLGAGAGGGLTSVLGLLKNAGKAGDVLAQIPGSADRFSRRLVKKEVGPRYADEVADGLNLAEPFETSGQAVSHLPGGGPLVAMQKSISKNRGGISADFDDIYRTQRSNPATPDELVRRALYERPMHRSGFNLNVAKEVGGDLPVISKLPLIRSVLKGRADAAEPGVKEALSRLLRNPLEMEQALRNVPPSQRQQMVELLIQRAPAAISADKESE